MKALRILTLGLSLVGLVSAPAGIASAQGMGGPPPHAGGPPPVVPLSIQLVGELGPRLGKAKRPGGVHSIHGVVTGSILSTPFEGTGAGSIANVALSAGSTVEPFFPLLTISTDLGIVFRLHCRFRQDPEDELGVLNGECTVKAHPQRPKRGGLLVRGRLAGRGTATLILVDGVPPMEGEGIVYVFDGHARCSFAICQDDGADMCTDDSDCPEGEVCDPFTAMCVPGPDECLDDSDCTSELECRCIAGLCEADPVCDVAPRSATEVRRGSCVPAQ